MQQRWRLGLWLLPTQTVALLRTGGNFADRRGRRACFLGSGLLTTTAGILAAFAPTYSWLLAARFLCGVGLGGVPVTFSMVLEFLPGGELFSLLARH